VEPPYSWRTGCRCRCESPKSSPSRPNAVTLRGQSVSLLTFCRRSVQAHAPEGRQVNLGARAQLSHSMPLRSTQDPRSPHRGTPRPTSSSRRARYVPDRTVNRGDPRSPEDARVRCLTCAYAAQHAPRRAFQAGHAGSIPVIRSSSGAFLAFVFWCISLPHTLSGLGLRRRLGTAVLAGGLT